MLIRHQRCTGPVGRRAGALARGARPVEQVLEWAGLSLKARSTHRTLTSAELDRLAADGLVETVVILPTTRG